MLTPWALGLVVISIPNALVLKPLAAAEGMAASAGGADAVFRPPLRRVQRSENGRYRLEISAVDGWRSPVARGQLWLVANDPPQLIWDRVLPQPYGPRRMLVTPGGRVLLIDEASNVRSRHALVLLDPEGKTVLHESFDQIQAFVALPAALLVQRALNGSWWLGGEPQLVAKGERVRLPVGGRTLELDLVSGRWIKPAPPPAR